MNTFWIKLVDCIKFFGIRDPYIVYEFNHQIFIGIVRHGFPPGIYRHIVSLLPTQLVHEYNSNMIKEQSYNLEYLVKKYFVDLL